MAVVEPGPRPERSHDVRTLLRRLGTRTSISAGLIVVVALVLLVARLAGNNDKASESSRPGPIPSIDMSAGDDGPVAPTYSAFADDAEVRAAAATFMQSWMRRSLSSEDWHAALVPLTTASLATSLEGVDPVVVPATRITGDVTVTLRSDLYALLSVPVDTGTVELGLLKQNNTWLVDSVDWQRA
jgi:hypothetical protein